jgi:uncharacterized protein YecE (DUF72 family)
MDLRVGTSGYQYKFWRGTFYSEKCKEADMLSEYGRQLRTVEINYTFYRMPKPEIMEKWASQVPDGFRFSIKASRRITHDKRLKDVGELTGYLFDTCKKLGDKLGVVLFQLPPNLKLDMDRLDKFLELIPSDIRVALEVRNPTWLDEAVYGKLRERSVALVCNDQGEGEEAIPLVQTAPFAYLRVRREEYTDDELKETLASVRAQPFEDVYVFFKHEEGAAVRAQRLIALSVQQPGQ